MATKPRQISEETRERMRARAAAMRARLAAKRAGQGAGQGAREVVEELTVHTVSDPNARELSRAELLEMRIRAVNHAQDHLISFARMMRPDPKNPDDPRRSTYQSTRHHRFIAEKLEAVCRGEIKRLIITVPPRHGKSELASKIFPAYFAGRFPHKSLILATYNERFGYDYGRAVREYIQSPQFLQIFPQARLKRGNASSNRLQTREGGALFFTGRGGTITGRGGDVLIVDDLLKDRVEADSDTIRNQMWAWWNQVFKSRQMDDKAAIVVIGTRWHDDDLIGRLIDDTNPHYSAEEAAKWEVIDLPALAVENDPLGREVGEALWPERFSVEFFEDMRRSDPRGFSALYQCRPAPQEGALFKAEWLKEYKPKDLPSDLRFYMSIDLAVSGDQSRDKTCLLAFGVDENNVIWVLPDTWWRSATSDVVVEAFVNLVDRRRPLMVWGEKGQIAKSLGPFLRKRMAERHVFASIDETHPAFDKVARAQSILARVAEGKVRFPALAAWWPQAKDQILKFPHSSRDDFVDALSLAGMGLMKQIGAKRQRRVEDLDGMPKVGSYKWIRWAHEREQRIISIGEGTEGW